MTPVSKLYAELMKVNPHFIIVYDTNTSKTKLVEGDFEISSEDNIDQAILKAWVKIFGMNKEEIYGKQ